jgi:uncharacterized membrane-anchored protein
MKKFIFILFGVMCLAQWIVPGKIIYDSERILEEGTVYKFKTAPIDPSDPFRGKYITLNFEQNFLTFTDSLEWSTGQEIFVTFTVDSAGYAVPERAFHDQPPSKTYLRTNVEYVNYYGDNYKVEFRLPFDRLYLEESRASEAEKAYWQAQQDSAQAAYALVSIGDGQAVLKDVIINDKPIHDIINELNKDPE